MNNALRGAYILVTRPANQAENLCQLIEAQGGIPVRFPTIEIIGVDEGAKATKTNPKLSKYQWLIFTSANAVNFALQAKGGKIDEIKSAQIAAIGQATARELIKAGLTVNLIPKKGFDSEALLAMPTLQAVEGQDILIVRGQGGRDELARGLTKRGALVDFWEVYRRVIPAIDNTKVLELINKDKVNAIIVTSYEALLNLLSMLGLDYHKKLAIIPLVVISERIKKLAIDLGFMRIAVAASPSDTAIVETTIAIINEE